jgi:hypothetical protein
MLGCSCLHGFHTDWAIMGDDKQGTIHSSSDGGVIGRYPDPDPSELLVAPATSDESNTARLRLIPIACFRLDNPRFMFDSSFVLPAAQAEMKAFADLRKSNPKYDKAPISIFGHADPSYEGNFELGISTYQSGDDYNKTLSGRRAIAIYALLIRDPSFWNTLYSNHLGGDVWGTSSVQIMLDALNQQGGSSFGSSSQGSSSSAQNARAQDIANDGGQRQQLFLQYMNFLCGDLTLDKSADFLARNAGPGQKGDVQGCSRFNPVLLFSTEDEARYKQAYQSNDKDTLLERNGANAVNRRVVILVFRKGSQVLPARWPCPSYKDGAADCKKRFFSDGDSRRSTHTSGAPHTYDDSQDTFACRFFQRISTGSPCNSVQPVCWTDDYDKEIDRPSYRNYFRKYQADGTEYTSMPPKFAGKIYVPLKTGGNITVEVRFKQQALHGVSADDVTAARTKLETGIQDNWNGQFTMEITDPACGNKSFPIEYKVVWVDSGQNYTIKIHKTYDREGVTGTVMDVSKATSDWTYAHEFGHCVGLPDEYSYVRGSTETVKYVKPDGTLDDPVSAPFDGKATDAADATIMAAVDNTTVLPRHGWDVAIEVQKLLTAKLGRPIKCSISTD